MFSCKSILRLMGVAVVLTAVLSSCSTPKDITYFQDVSDGSRHEVMMPKELVAEPGDKLTITVHSKDPQLAQLFNLPIASNRVGQYTSAGTTSTGSGNVASYTIDSSGDIDFPVLGTLHIRGMKRQEIAEYIKKELIQRNLVKDPTVIVEFIGRGVNVLGEVGRPGRVDMDRDKFTIIDAITGAGDLTIQGRRDNVIVLRNEDGRVVAHQVDLTNANSVLNSPVYYLQQEDVVYVEPTDVKKRTTTANGNSVFTPAFWISIVSFATTLLLLVKNW